MNSSEKFPLVDAQTLLTLRKETNALSVITEMLRVKEMGPADHIRTKHEVKVFIESGTAKSAETLTLLAKERLIANDLAERRLTQSRELGHRLS